MLGRWSAGFAVLALAGAACAQSADALKAAVQAIHKANAGGDAAAAAKLTGDLLPDEARIKKGYLGDSVRAVSEVDVLTFSIGIALGLAVGLVPLTLPGGFTVRLGLAGGPLVAALVLGILHRTGPLLWTMPYGANLTLRQVGIVLFLAGVGTRAGHQFLTMLVGGGGVTIVLCGLAVTLTASTAVLAIGHRWMRMPLGYAMGMLAGLQTQPALLGFAVEQTGDDRPNLGYAAVYPLAMIMKIVVAQALLRVLGG